MKKIAAMLVLATMVGVVWAADEITTGCSLEVNKGILAFAVSASGAKATMTGDAIDRKTSTFTTNGGVLVVSADITDAGFIFLKNTSTNETALVGVSTNAPFIKLAPGAGWLGNLATNLVAVIPQGSNSVVVESILLSR